MPPSSSSRPSTSNRNHTLFDVEREGHGARDDDGIPLKPIRKGPSDSAIKDFDFGDEEEEERRGEDDLGVKRDSDGEGHEEDDDDMPLDNNEREGLLGEGSGSSSRRIGGRGRRGGRRGRGTEDDGIELGEGWDEKDNRDDELEDLPQKTREAMEVVSKVVPPVDDPTLPALTFRVLFLGMILCSIGAAISQLFYFKSNAPSFSSFFIILISYPFGKYMAKILPTRDIVIPLPRWFPFHTKGEGGPIGLDADGGARRGKEWRWSLNPGPFNKKEHLLIAVLAGSGSWASYAGDIVAIQSLYYHQELPFLGGMLLLLSSQLIGFGFAGLLYPLLVRPTVMLWPSTLVLVTLFETLHGPFKTPATGSSRTVGSSDSPSSESQSPSSCESQAEGTLAYSPALTRARLNFFLIAFVLTFVYQFLPSVIMPTLTSIALLCILSPTKPPILRVLGSGYDGMGLFDFSLDWAVIGAGGLYTPFFAQASFFAGMVASLWIVAPSLWFGDIWNSREFDSPIAAKLYNSKFEKFDVDSVIVRDTLELNETAWAEQGPLFITPFFAVSYGISFAILTSAVTSVILWNWKDIRDAVTGSRQGQPRDIHVELLEENYEAVPRSWYATVGGSMLAAAAYVVVVYPLQMPLWALFLALLVAIVFLVPCGIIAAITNTTIGLNVITEFIAGYLLPGRPLANVTFKVYGYMVLVQCIDLVSDLKLALYSKIPPKDMFICQTLGTATGSIVNYAFIKGVIESKRPYLDGTLNDPTGQWTGRAPAIFYSASVIWGLIGPARFFSGRYSVLYLGFPIGLILPLIPYFLHRRYPNRHFDQISIPLILHGGIASPQTPANVIIPGFLTSFASQYWARRNRKEWFEKYNYVLSSALDAGTSVNALVVYMLGWNTFWQWWGNNDIDAEHCQPGS